MANVYIAFTQLKPSYWQFKTASALKKKGQKTALVCLLKKFNEAEYLKAFDLILCPGLENLKPKNVFMHILKHPAVFFSFFAKLFFLKTKIAICEGAPHYLAALFMMFFKLKCKTIYFPYDMISSRYKKPEEHNLPREIWGEKYCLKKCDGLIYKSAESELDLLPKEFNIKSKPCFGFPNYTQKELFATPNMKIKLSKKDGDIHLVNAGTYTEGTSLYLSMADYLYKLLEQGFHVHFFSASGPLKEKDVETITKGDKKLGKRLHVSDKVFSPRGLSEELGKYDYGLNMNYLSDIAKDKAKELAATNKLASYLEAGIPIFHNEEVKFFADMIAENNIGVVIKKKELDKGLLQRVKKLNYKKMLDSIVKFREEYEIDKHVGELIEFLRKVAG